VSDTVNREKERSYMKTFTIDTDNNISTFASQQEAAASTTAPFESFSSQTELSQLAGAWPTERLVAICNSLPGVKPAKGFKTAKAGATKIWESIQGLGDAATPVKPKAETKTKGAASAAKGATAKAKTTKKTTVAKAAKHMPEAKNKKIVQAQAIAGPREGSKTAQVIAMLQRKNGATLSEIMEKMGWQKHTVRGFMAGAMKKAGYVVESFQSDKGERTYRINA
jgi:hypothetical protein